MQIYTMNSEKLKNCKWKQESAYEAAADGIIRRRKIKRGVAIICILQNIFSTENGFLLFIIGIKKTCRIRE